MAYDGSTYAAEPQVAELRASGLGIRASCRCGHERTLDSRKVCVPSSIEVRHVGALLRCSRCGAKGLETEPGRL